MFQKYNSFTNSLSTPSDPVSAYVPKSLGNKEATNNYFIAPQPKGREPGGSGPPSAGSIAGRQMSVTRFLLRKIGIGSSSVALTTQAASSAAHSVAATAQSVAATAQSVAATAAHSVAANAQSVAAAAAKSVAATIQSAASTAQAAATSATQAVASNVSSHAAGGSHAVQSHGHGHGSHAAPWEGVNLWRTPYKGDTDTITQVKRNKGSLDRFVEERTRRIQQLQLLALRNKHIPTWVMMPRDKIIYAAQGVVVVYVLYQVATAVYQHLKAKDRLKLIKLLYKDNVN